MNRDRIRTDKLYDKIMSADDAARIVRDGMTVGVSGFTPSGYPKAVPEALSRRVEEGEKLTVTLYSGASVGPEIDDTWASNGMISRRLPYQTSVPLRNRINNGEIHYCDMHLSSSMQLLKSTGKKIDVAIIEALAITEDGNLIPTIGLGNGAAFVEIADKIIVEINERCPESFENMADIYNIPNPPNREPLNITRVSDRIGYPFIKCDIDKIEAVVITSKKDSTRDFTKPDGISEKISDNLISFLEEEKKVGIISDDFLVLQSGVGSVANAVLYGLEKSSFHNINCYTEVIQDSMLDLIRSGKAKFASATAISPSPSEIDRFYREIDFFKDKILLRPQDISNNPEVIRRLGVVAINTAVELDIYGNVNSTHVSGTRMLNGIGGSGDFARNAMISIFVTPSDAKGGNISSIVPMVSHVDHTEHDVMVIVTEHGYADLRGISPKERAVKIIGNCASPDYRDALMDYFVRACNGSNIHTPHILSEALSWYETYEKSGTMKK